MADKLTLDKIKQAIEDAGYSTSDEIAFIDIGGMPEHIEVTKTVIGLTIVGD